MSKDIIGQRSRNEEEKQLRQAQILKAALLEFDEKGYDQTTMTGISRRSKLSRSLVNFYFGDMAGIHNAIEQAAIEQLVAMFNRAIEDQHRGIDQLKAIVAAFVKFNKSHPAYFEALARDDEGANSKIPLKASSQEVMNIISQVIETGLHDGSIKHQFENILQASLSLWATAYGAILLTNKKKRILEHHWNARPDTLLRGLEVLVASSFATGD